MRRVCGWMGSGFAGDCEFWEEDAGLVAHFVAVVVSAPHSGAQVLSALGAGASNTTTFTVVEPTSTPTFKYCGDGLVALSTSKWSGLSTFHTPSLFGELY